MPRASGFFQTDPHPTPFFERAPAALSHYGKNRGSVPLRDGQAAAGRPHDRPAAAMRRERAASPCEGFPYAAEKSGEAKRRLLRMDIQNFGTDLTPVFMLDLIDPLLILGVSEPVFGKTGQQMG